MNKFFFDTNVLVYSVDKAHGLKHEKAKQMLTRHTKIEGGVISTQVLQEYYAVITGKLKIKPASAKDLIKQLDYEIIDIDFDIILEAIDIQVDYKISFWDGLIVASALSAGCDKLFTEDLNHLQRIRSLTLENPFRMA